jgi:hypothetical protein
MWHIVVTNVPVFKNVVVAEKTILPFWKVWGRNTLLLAFILRVNLGGISALTVTRSAIQPCSCVFGYMAPLHARARGALGSI